MKVNSGQKFSMNKVLIKVQTYQIIERLFNVNLFGAIKMIKFFLPLLKISKGRIINMSSLTGEVIFRLVDNTRLNS